MQYFFFLRNFTHTEKIAYNLLSLHCRAEATFYHPSGILPSSPHTPQYHFEGSCCHLGFAGGDACVSTVCCFQSKSAGLAKTHYLNCQH